MAGSIPINGTLYFVRNSFIAFVVAVLQATMIILQFSSSKSSVFLQLSAIISSFDFNP
jgi:hypothetical protein